MKAPTILEIGTSFGYSAIWLAEAALSAGGRVITMEIHGYESEYAQRMANKAGLSDIIEFQIDDAVFRALGFPYPTKFRLSGIMTSPSSAIF
ncbi:MULTISPECIES: O-methyltransferase [unclassified Agrobacterium]